MPISVNQACLYVTYLAENLKVSSIITYYQAIVFYHVCAGLEPVRLSNPTLKATIKGIEKGESKSACGKDPMFPEHLLAMGKVVDFDSNLEVLVFIAVLLMFRTLLRVSHIVSSNHMLLRGDVKWDGETVLLSVRSSKTDQIGKGCTVPVSASRDPALCPVRALMFLFKKFSRSKRVQLFSCSTVPCLTYSMFAKCFKKLVLRAGLKGDFASHSLRRGGATYMSLLNCSIPEIKSRGMWKSDCVFKYIVPDLEAKKVSDRKVALNS